jgi:acyl-coenzyme A thioesterase PaaI-like protein
MWLETLRLRAWARINVPMIAYLAPSVVLSSDDEIAIRIRLRRRSKNHLKSMYFGALQVGADVAGGFMALRHAQAAGQPISFVFKDAEASFLRRAESDVTFTCGDGRVIRRTVEAAIASGERHEIPVRIDATCDGERVAQFTLTLSLRRKR